MPTSAIRITHVKNGKVTDHKYAYKFDVSKSAITNNELWEPLTQWHTRPESSQILLREPQI